MHAGWAGGQRQHAWPLRPASSTHVTLIPTTNQSPAQGPASLLPGPPHHKTSTTATQHLSLQQRCRKVGQDVLEAHAAAEGGHRPAPQVLCRVDVGQGGGIRAQAQLARRLRPEVRGQGDAVRGSSLCGRVAGKAGPGSVACTRGSACGEPVALWRRNLPPTLTTLHPPPTGPAARRRCTAALGPAGTQTAAGGEKYTKYSQSRISYCWRSGSMDCLSNSLEGGVCRGQVEASCQAGVVVVAAGVQEARRTGGEGVPPPSSAAAQPIWPSRAEAISHRHSASPQQGELQVTHLPRLRDHTAMVDRQQVGRVHWLAEVNARGCHPDHLLLLLQRQLLRAGLAGGRALGRGQRRASSRGGG